MTPPEWLVPGGTPAPAVPRAGRTAPRLLRRTLGSLARTLAALAPAEPAGNAGPLRAADPRGKLVAALVLLVTATFLRTLPALAACLALALAAAALARPGARRAAAALGAGLLLSAAVALPATLNVVSGGEPLLTLWRGGLGPWRPPGGLAVTAGGLVVGARLLLRTAACLALALGLAASTSPRELTLAARGLGAPRAFALVLAMVERYAALLVRAAEEMHLARLARSIAPLGVRGEEAWTAAGIGAAFRRSRALADGVALAMTSRGFAGEVRLLRAPRSAAAVWTPIAVAVVLAGALLALDRGAA